LAHDWSIRPVYDTTEEPESPGRSDSLEHALESISDALIGLQLIRTLAASPVVELDEIRARVAEGIESLSQAISQLRTLLADSTSSVAVGFVLAGARGHSNSRRTA
jgi:hypothetical protein